MPDIPEDCPITPPPEDRVSSVSALCSYGMRPHVMTGFLRQLLIAHFADPANIEDQRLRQKFIDEGAWTSDDNGLANTGILIESITRWQPNIEDKRPTILVKRGGWSWQRIGIGDRAGANFVTGSSSYTGLWQGSHTLYCLSTTGLEAELLTMETVRFLQHFGPWIREQMSLMKLIVSEVGGISEVQEVVDGYAVPITVTYVAEEAWELQPYVPRLKRIVLKASELFSC